MCHDLMGSVSRIHQPCCHCCHCSCIYNILKNTRTFLNFIKKKFHECYLTTYSLPCYYRFSFINEYSYKMYGNKSNLQLLKDKKKEGVIHYFYDVFDILKLNVIEHDHLHHQYRINVYKI